MHSRHVILTLGRSGSNTLVNLFNQHPQLLNVGEVIGPWNTVRKIRDRLHLYTDNDAAYLDAVTQASLLVRSLNVGRSVSKLAKRQHHNLKRIKDVKSFGFKDFVTLMQEKEIEKWLLNNHDVKIIGLIRDNLLERFVSWQLLDKTGIVSVSNKENFSHSTINIDPKKIVSLLETVDLEHALLHKTLQSIPKGRLHQIRYDEFFSDTETRQEILASIFSFLRVAPFRPEVRMNKIVSIPARDMINNKEECQVALEGTRFEGLLDK